MTNSVKRLQADVVIAGGGPPDTSTNSGRSKAIEMLLTDNWINADEAWRINLVNRVVPRDKLLDTAEKMAKKIASYDPMAVLYAKEAVGYDTCGRFKSGKNAQILSDSQSQSQVISATMG